TPGEKDGIEAGRFKLALKDCYAVITASAQAGAVKPKTQLDLPFIADRTMDALDPRVTIPRRVLTGVFIPPRIRVEIGNEFVEAMLYPNSDRRMYSPLKTLSSELFLPNIT